MSAQQEFPLEVDVVRPDLDAIEAREHATTPGPWLTDDTDPSGIWTMGETVLGGTIAYIKYDHQTGDHHPAEDAAFIAEAKQDVARLVSYARLLEAQVAALRRGGSVAP